MSKTDSPLQVPSPKAYLGLARKWRPQTFAELVGQETVAESLSKAIESGRLIQGHILAGPRGVGKTTSARILARALNCVQGPSAVPCGRCVQCVEIAAGATSMDVVELDAASRTGVDDMRELLEHAALAPFSSRFKVYIIDEVHMLSKGSFNALLKTLEEPPEHVIFIFATTELEKIPETVQSRCVVHHFRRLSSEDIVRRLSQVAEGEGLKVDPSGREALGLIARSVEGGMRDALVALDQLLVTTGGKLELDAAQKLLGLSTQQTLADTVQWIAEGDAKALIRLVGEIVSRGRSLERFVKSLIAFVHEIMLLQADPKGEFATLTGDALERARALASQLSEAAVFNMLNQLFDLEHKLRRSTLGRFVLEFTFLRMAAVKRLVPLDELLERINAPEPPTSPATARPPSREPRAGAASRSLGESSRRPARPSPATAHPAGVLREGGGKFDESPGKPTEDRSNPLEGLAPDELLHLILPMLPDGGRVLEGYLAMAVSMRADGRSLWIQWAKNDRVGSRVLARPEHRDQLERALTQIAGRPMTVRSSVSQEATAAASEPRAMRPATVARDSGPPPADPGPPYEYSDEPPRAEAAFPPAEPASGAREASRPGLSITEAATRQALQGEGDFALRAKLVRDFFNGSFIDGRGRPISI